MRWREHSKAGLCRCELMPSVQSDARGALDKKTVRLHGDRQQVVASQCCLSAVAMLNLSVIPESVTPTCNTTVVARNTTRILGPRFMLFCHYDSCTCKLPPFGGAGGGGVQPQKHLLFQEWQLQQSRNSYIRHDVSRFLCKLSACMTKPQNDAQALCGVVQFIAQQPACW